MTLAKDLAFLIEETSISDVRKLKSRMQLKIPLVFHIKKRVKEQYLNGKLHGLMMRVIANPETLRDAYNCIRLNSNIGIASEDDDAICFEHMEEELASGNFERIEA